MSAEEQIQKEAGKSSELEKAFEPEHQFLHEQLRTELGREPTQEELDEWLREHTEGY